MEKHHIIHCLDSSSRVRADLARTILGLGYHAEVYANLEELTNCRPENGLIIAKDQMETGGIPELARRLRAADILLPIVGYSEEPAISQSVAALKAGALDYLALPSDMARLEEILGDLVGEANALMEALRVISDARKRLDKLSPRERDVVDRLALGMTNKEIARELGISPRTVEIHRANMKQKLGARHSAEAVRLHITAQRNAGPLDGLKRIPPLKGKGGHGDHGSSQAAVA